MAKYQMLLLLAIFIAALFCVENAATATQAAEQTEEQGALIGSKNSPYLSCAAACDYRCSKASLHKRCLKYCNICCGKCLCVPPGTAGNREVCPCYNEMKNSRGGHKCP